jgi:anti-sigma-K factor RskA
MNDDKHVIDLLPGLALGSLEPGEERHARQHLARCPACQEELAVMEEVVGRVAMALPAADPPPGLEARIMERIVRTAAPGGPKREPAETRARTRVQTAVPFFRHPAVAAIAAALILFLGGGNVVQWVRGAAAARTPVAPGFITIVLKGADPSQKIAGTMVLDADNFGGTLAMRGLPQLDAAHQYQLWLVRDGTRRSGGVFDADSWGYANLLLRVPNDFKDFTSIGISVEPAGGSPAPTGTRVAAGKL